jgi:hypothetical protein
MSWRHSPEMINFPMTINDSGCQPYPYKNEDNLDAACKIEQGEDCIHVVAGIRTCMKRVNALWRENKENLNK